MIFDDTPCTLGEGALWHPDRQSLFWFDIVNRHLYERALTGATRRIDLPRMGSAAGIVDRDRLVVALSDGLHVMDLRDATLTPLAAFGDVDPALRSNDGRADPQGGFWIGTMGRQAQPGAGAIWRFHRGRMRRLFDAVTIPNAICFSPDGRLAHYADTARSMIWQVTLDAEGWPAGAPRPFLDLSAEGLNPDGAVVDAEGFLWSAQWGAGRVARYDPQGRLDRVVPLGAQQVSCPAFGGPALTTLFATSAREGMEHPSDQDGCTLAVPDAGQGRAEHRVRLD